MVYLTVKDGNICVNNLLVKIYYSLTIVIYISSFVSAINLVKLS